MKIFVCLFVIFVDVCFGQTETAVENDCGKACPFNYEPVCCTYSDGSTLTHGNACAAKVYNCYENITPTTTNEGECDAQTAEPAIESACPEIFCASRYDPVCCTYVDGSTRTFASDCFASSINCGEGKTCETQTKGECGKYRILPAPRSKKPYIFVPNDAPAA